MNKEEAEVCTSVGRARRGLVMGWQLGTAPWRKVARSYLVRRGSYLVRRGRRVPSRMCSALEWYCSDTFTLCDCKALATKDCIEAHDSREL